jgi:hypothetical protein
MPISSSDVCSFFVGNDVLGISLGKIDISGTSGMGCWKQLEFNIVQLCMCPYFQSDVMLMVDLAC